MQKPQLAKFINTEFLYLIAMEVWDHIREESSKPAKVMAKLNFFLRLLRKRSQRKHRRRY